MVRNITSTDKVFTKTAVLSIVCSLTLTETEQTIFKTKMQTQQEYLNNTRVINADCFFI